MFANFELRSRKAVIAKAGQFVPLFLFSNRNHSRRHRVIQLQKVLILGVWRLVKTEDKVFYALCELINSQLKNEFTRLLYEEEKQRITKSKW